MPCKLTSRPSSSLGKRSQSGRRVVWARAQVADYRAGGSGGGTIGSNGTDIDITPRRLKNAGPAGRFRSVEGRRRGLIRGIHFLDRSNHFLDRMLKFWLANARPNRQTLRYPPLTETAFSQESNM